MAKVTIDDIRKAYGQVEVVHGIDLTIEDGEFLVLVGPSGCGKSTLLRMIAGLEEISGGTVSIGDEVVNDLEPKERNIAMVFQNYALYPHMTVAQNMAFSLRLSGTPKQDIASKVEKTAAILGLEALLDRFPGQLSGGQRQRVAMGRAIVREPAVFLFDEPLSNLDAKLRVQMRTEIKSLHQRLKTTTIYVTHDQIEAMTMADRIVIMQGGNVEQVGTPLDLYDNPNSMFVAGFIGSPSINFFPGEMRDGLFTGLGGLKSAAAIADGAVTAGVRPNKLTLDPNGSDWKVEVVEPTGAETLIVLRSDQSEITVATGNRVDLRPGARVGIACDDEDVLFFDTETGDRIAA